MARDNQKLNGSWADFPKAATMTPTVMTADHAPVASESEPRAREPTCPLASAAPAAR